MGQRVQRLWPIEYFQDGRRPPCWIFRSTDITIRTLDPENPTLESKFLTLAYMKQELWRLKNFKIFNIGAMGIFQFFGGAKVKILELCFETPKRHFLIRNRIL